MSSIHGCRVRAGGSGPIESGLGARTRRNPLAMNIAACRRGVAAELKTSPCEHGGIAV